MEWDRGVSFLEKFSFFILNYVIILTVCSCFKTLPKIFLLPV